MALFEISNLTYYYPETQTPALNNLDLSIEEGELLLITGPTGSGKTTLLRSLAGIVPSFLGGRFGGDIFYRGEKLRDLAGRKLSREIGFVSDCPERQLLLTEVESELAFGPENLGAPPQTIRRRVMEISSALGIAGLLDSSTQALSGGMKQRVALGAVMAMEPRVLILDEPTSQLDPMAATEFIELLARLRNELGYTVILAEQRLDTCLPRADRVLFLAGGDIAFNGAPIPFCKWAAGAYSGYLPPATRLFSYTEDGSPPLTMGDARRRIKKSVLPGFNPSRRSLPIGRCVAKATKLLYTYGNGATALRGVDIDIHAGEMVAVLGPNGAGKSTLLKVLSGILPPTRGTATVNGRELSKCGNAEKAASCGYLSQNPDDFLFHETVRDEVAYKLRNIGLYHADTVQETLRQWDLSDIQDMNPRELSLGKRQCVALAASTIGKPPLLLLDEPARGLDPGQKERLGNRLKSFVSGAGSAALVVTQDIEFAARWAERIVLLFGGEIVAAGSKYGILKGDPFYSTQISRLFHNIADCVVTVEEAIELLNHPNPVSGEGTH